MVPEGPSCLQKPWWRVTSALFWDTREVEIAQSTPIPQPAEPSQGALPLLTVDYARLGLRRGELLLDLGCGAGRHAFEAVRLGARAVAVDADPAEVTGVAAMLALMSAEAGPPAAGTTAATRPGTGTVVRADAGLLPFADATFDRVIAAEVLEHLPADTVAMAELARILRPGGTMAVSVPRFGPELVNWALSERYHKRPGGHVRIYRRSQLVQRLAGAGLQITGAHHAHALHTPYWWLRCALGVDNEAHPAVKAYHRMLVWDIVEAPALTRVTEHILNPILGKSLVLYLVRQAPQG